MYSFDSKGFEIAFDDEGQGDRISLLRLATDRRGSRRMTGCLLGFLAYR